MISHSFYYLEQRQWAKDASNCKVAIHHGEALPVAQIECMQDSAAWQGVSAVRTLPAEEAFERPFDFRTFRFDFGRHLVGRLEFRLGLSRPNDAPVRIRCKFAETPYELATDFATYHGHLDRSWLQEEVFLFDTLPEIIRLPRRYAFRYLEIEFGSPNYMTRLVSLRCITETSAGEALPPPNGLSEEDLAVDKVCVNTLRNCMQSLFEDGPKRDRRLWLGDLWIQAKVNAVTFRNFELAEKCICLFASLADCDGLVPGSLSLRENGAMADCSVITYALLFPSLVLDHLCFTGNERLCRSMLPVARRQLELFGEAVDDNGVLHPKDGWWLFIDQDLDLWRETPAMAMYVFALREYAALLDALNEKKDMVFTEKAERLSESLRRRLWNAPRGLMASDGDAMQFSWATQAWMILGDVPLREQSQVIWDNAVKDPQIIQPKTPFLWNMLLMAGIKLGRRTEVMKIIKKYWGGMIKRGADTFWEEYVEDDPMYSSYGDPLMNSACHAWSCFPSYVFRESFVECQKKG